MTEVSKGCSYAVFSKHHCTGNVVRPCIHDIKRDSIATPVCLKPGLPASRRPTLTNGFIKDHSVFIIEAPAGLAAGFEPW